MVTCLLVVLEPGTTFYSANNFCVAFFCFGPLTILTPCHLRSEELRDDQSDKTSKASSKTNSVDHDECPEQTAEIPSKKRKQNLQ